MTRHQPMMAAFTCAFLVLLISNSHAFLQQHHTIRRQQSLTSLNVDTKSPDGIVLVTQASSALLKEQGVFGWEKWGCKPGSFPWTYDQNESAYLIRGKVTVQPHDSRHPPVIIEAGDFITFPAGMSCDWHVTDPVEKHFKLF